MTIPAIACAALIAVGLAVGVQPAIAQQGNAAESIEMIPAIWIDPDGCEHFVMDDGLEGYMDIRLDRNGKPFCGRKHNTCAVIGSDTLFGTNDFEVADNVRVVLADFFKRTRAKSYVISGHTDNRGSDTYNLNLSLNRAKAVADVAAELHAKVTQVQGFGERQPIDNNATSAGRAANRRVEIECDY